MRVVGHNCDIAVRQQLDAAGVRYFQPLDNVLRQYKTRPPRLIEKPVVAGLFFAYGTIRAIDEQVRESGNRLQWVFQRGTSQVRHRNIPTKEMEDFIRVVEARIEQMQYRRFADVEKLKNRRVRILSGVLAGTEGKISSLRAKKKTFTVVLSNLLAVQVSLTDGIFEVLD